MTTPSPQRADLYARLEEVLGSSHADTLMTYLPDQSGADVATKSDIADLGSRIDDLAAHMEQRFEQVDVRFAQMERQFERVDHRFEHMENRFHTIRDDLRDQLKTFTLTVVAAMTALTAVYAGLLAVIP